MPRTLLIAVLLLAPSLNAQQMPPSASYGSIRTAEIQLGSDTTPTIIKVPPVIEVSSAPAEPPVSYAPPASTALLATRHFDFIVSPVAPFSTQGSMADTSISLGEYARQLRAEKQAATPKTPPPDAMAQPAEPK
jgi:hypothetical protein